MVGGKGGGLIAGGRVPKMVRRYKITVTAENHQPANYTKHTGNRTSADGTNTDRTL